MIKEFLLPTFIKIDRLIDSRSCCYRPRFAL